MLHYNKLDRKIEDGDIVVMDVGGQYSGYAADITRTLPANGKFTPRQREIYEIVLGAQNAALAALKPGMTIYGQGPTSLQKIAMDYINSHGKDKEGRSLGRYYIHGLSHHIGLNVHDPERSAAPPRSRAWSSPIEPGIYIPEENIGVRIEDDVLITPTGYKLLTARLPRSPDEIEKIMAEGKAEREKAAPCRALTVRWPGVYNRKFGGRRARLARPSRATLNRSGYQPPAARSRRHQERMKCEQHNCVPE